MILSGGSRATREAIEELHNNLARSYGCWTLRDRYLGQIWFRISPTMTYFILESSGIRKKNCTYPYRQLYNAEASLEYHHKSKRNAARRHWRDFLGSCWCIHYAGPTSQAYINISSPNSYIKPHIPLTNQELGVQVRHHPDLHRNAQSYQLHRESRGLEWESK